MIFKLVLLCALVAAPALSLAIKGRTEEAAQSKGGRLLAPIEQQKLINEQHLQQQAEQKLEEVQQQKQEELKQEEVKGQAALRYEARPQVQQREEPSKAAPAAPAAKIEQQREEQPASKTVASATRYEQKQEEVRVEQQQQQLQRADIYESQQQIELKEEQRRYEEPIQQQQQFTAQLEEQQITQQALGGTKGGVAAYLGAPLADAEPYAFSYQVDGSSRSESGDTKGVVRGQYTVQGADGSSRVVDYVADHNGFRASVNTNEFGTEAKSPANVALRSSQPLAEDITLRLEGKTREDLAPPAAAATKSAPAPVKGLAAPLPLPQAQIQVDEVVQVAAAAPTKGAAPAAAPTKTKLEEIVRAPAKGQRLVVQQQEEQQQQAELSQAPELPVKSAETARAPKAVGELKLARSGFESATAHRVYRPVAPVVATRTHIVPPAVPVRSHPPTVVRGPVAAVSRTYLQRERYPPSPVQSGAYPRRPSSVSFYSPSAAAAGFDDDLQPAGFEPLDS